MSAIDGLVSGMNTSEVIQQLLQLERQPVVRLQGKKTAADKAVTALQGLNTKFLAIADLAKKLSGTTGWSPTKTNISHPEMVGVTVAEGTEPTSLSFQVKSLAAAHQIYSSSTYASETEAVSNAGRDITIDYTDANGAAASLVVNNHDGTLSGIAAAINGTTASPVSARVVKTSDAGDYRLEFTAKETGANSAFTVAGIRQTGGGTGTTDMLFTTGTQASDAEVLFGSTSPMSIKSSDNTLNDIAPGVTLNLKAADVNKTVTVDITRDPEVISGDVEKLIEAANAFLKESKTLTAYDADSKKAGVLQGDRTVSELQNSVLRAVSDAVGGQSAATAGIELNKDGTIKFDKAKFESAYAADPAAVKAMFNGGEGTQGIAQRLAAVAETATKFSSGRLTQAIEARRNEIKRIDDSIAVWDVRLARKEAALRKQFAALETALGNAQQQGNWLAGQINSLPSYE